MKKTPTTQALHTAALTGLLSLALLSPTTAADFTGSLKGVTITDAQATNKAPTAAFTYTVSGQTVTFNAGDSSDSDGTITEYKWDFGDGSSGTGQNATHSYASYGEYSATLTVADNGKAVSLLQKKIMYGAPAQLIGNSNIGLTTMGDSLDHIYIHKLYGKPLINGKLSKYRVTIATDKSATRAITLGLYTHDSNNNKPLKFVPGSDCGWISYTQTAGETFECTPSGDVPITSNTQYWIGVRGKDYASIRGNLSNDLYYDYYLSQSSSWRDVSGLLGETVKKGTASILQVEVIQ